MRAELRSRAQAAVPDAAPEDAAARPAAPPDALAPGVARVGEPQPAAHASAREGTAAALVDDAQGAMPASAATFVEMGIAAGVQMVVGILAHPKVREALQDLLASAQPKAAVESADTSRESTLRSGPPASPEAPILIVGVTPAQAVELERAYRGTMTLLFWTTEQSPDDLHDLVSRAAMVIAIVNAVSQAVDSSLSRMARH